MTELGTADLERGLAHIADSPRDHGTVEMLVRRPAVDEREVVALAEVEPGAGLIGDSWSGRPHPSPEADRWPLAGDQVYVDLDLGVENLPPGTRLRVGTVVVEVSAKPHTGCSKFSARFGPEALAFVNSDQGRAMRLRGMNVRVIQGGTLRTGDPIIKE